MRSARSLLLALALAAGCAPALSSFQPAHVAPRGHVQAQAGLDLSLPVGTIQKSIDAGRTLARAAESRTLDAAERRQVLEAGVNLALDPPAAVGHAGIAWTPVERWEVGVRRTPGAWRLAGRHQLRDQETDGWDLSVGLGLQRFAYRFPVREVLGILELEDFTRWSVDVPVVAGTRGRWYRLWGGPRVILTRYRSALRLDLPPVGGLPGEQVLASVEGSGAFLGAQGGVALGYRWLFVGLELTVVRLVSRARLALGDQSTDVDLGGVIVYPGVALMGEF